MRLFLRDALATDVPSRPEQSSRRNVTGVNMGPGVGLPGAGCSQKLSAALRRGKWSAGEPIAEF